MVRGRQNGIETCQQGQRETEQEREAKTQGKEGVRDKEKTEDKAMKIQEETHEENGVS